MDNHHKSVLFGLVLALSFVLSGCQLPTPKNSSTAIPTPLPEVGLVTGSVQDSAGNPLKDIPVRLAQVYREGTEGAFVLDLSHSPSSIATSTGNFVIIEIPPAEYLIVIGRPEDNNYIIYQDANGKAITYNIEGGKITDVGVIKVNFTP